MVVSNENNGDPSDLRPVDAAIGKTGHWIVIGGENETDAAVQVQGHLSLAVAGQRVRPACNQFAHMGSRLQVRQPTSQLARAGCAQFPYGKALFLAKRAEVVIGDIDFQPADSMLFTIPVNNIITGGAVSSIRWH